MLVLNRSQVEGMFLTLVRSGVKVTRACRILGMSRARGFYIVDRFQCRPTRRGRRRYVPVKMVETAEILIGHGMSLDVVVAATGLTGQQILDLFSKEG